MWLGSGIVGFVTANESVAQRFGVVGECGGGAAFWCGWGVGWWGLSLQMNRWGSVLVWLGSGIVGFITANESVGQQLCGWGVGVVGFVTVNESVRQRFGVVGEWGGGVCHCK